MGGYFRGVAIDAAIIGMLTWTLLSVIGLPFALPLAVLAATGEFVPYIGPVVAAVPAVATGLLHSTQQGLLVALTYVVIQQIEGHVVTPLVMRSQTRIHPAAVMVALTTGYTIGGLLGALAAIPMFAAIRVLLRHVIIPAVRRRAGRSRR
jgi:predicted PurR-regulated permease PerM